MKFKDAFFSCVQQLKTCVRVRIECMVGKTLAWEIINSLIASTLVRESRWTKRYTLNIRGLSGLVLNRHDSFMQLHCTLHSNT